MHGCLVVASVRPTPADPRMRGQVDPPGATAKVASPAACPRWQESFQLWLRDGILGNRCKFLVLVQKVTLVLAGDALPCVVLEGLLVQTPECKDKCTSCNATKLH